VIINTHTNRPVYSPHCCCLLVVSHFLTCCMVVSLIFE